MNARSWWIVAGFLCLPMATAAQELTVGADAKGSYISSTSSGNQNDGDEYTFRFSPDAVLEDYDGDLRWRLHYKPDYEWIATSSEKSGWTHRADGTLSWRINPATRLVVSDHFAFYDSVSRYNEVVTEGEGDQTVEVIDTGFRDDQSIRNTVSASLSRQLAPNRGLTFRFGHYMTDYDRAGRADRQTLSAAAHFTQTVSRRNVLGVGVSYRRASLDESSVQKGQSTDFYNVFGSWIHTFDETLVLTAALGPTWVKGDDRVDNLGVAEGRLTYPLVISADGETRLVRASSCPTEDGTLVLTGDCDVIDEDLPFVVDESGRVFHLFDEEVFSRWNPTRDLHLIGSVPSSSNETLTYFANIRLSKKWERWSGSLAYIRQESESSGLGSSAVADILSGILDWKPLPRWHFSLKASLTRQTSATEGVRTVIAVESANLDAEPPPGFPGLGPAFSDVAESVGIRAIEVDQDIEYLTFWAKLDVRYRATKRTTLFGDVSYWRQDRDGIAASALGDYDRYRVNFGVRYVFDPMRL